MTITQTQVNEVIIKVAKNSKTKQWIEEATIWQKTLKQMTRRPKKSLCSLMVVLPWQINEYLNLPKAKQCTKEGAIWQWKLCLVLTFLATLIKLSLQAIGVLIEFFPESAICSTQKRKLKTILAILNR